MRFSDILGQEKAKGFLNRVMALEKIPHAYLFVGVTGIGKKSTAEALATALNCISPKDGDGCGTCPSCHRIASGNDPDFTVVRPDGRKIKIDQIRGLNRGLAFAPVSARYRVIVICQAEAMTAEAANAFLKTLEEPPPGNIFILTAAEPLDLLPTIVSRCQKISFQPLPIPAIANWLAEKEGMSGERSNTIARLSCGSLGRAAEMAESGFLEKRDEWLSRIAELPWLTADEALNAVFEWAEGFKALQMSGEKNGDADLLAVLDFWKSWYRDLLVVKAGAEDEYLVNGDYSRKLKKVSSGYKMTCLVKSFHLIDRAQRELAENRNVILVMEHLVRKLKTLAGAPEWS